MRLLIVPLIFLGLALMPTQVEGKPLHGASECVRFYRDYAKAHDVPPNWIGQKVSWNCTGR